MRTPWSSIGMYLLASVLGAAGQFLYKTGAGRASWAALIARWAYGVARRPL